jgi:ribosomal-protein-alanine N-acetyltransferase
VVTGVRETTIRTMSIADIETVFEIDRLSFSLPWSERTYRLELTENPAAHLYVAVKKKHNIEYILGYIGFWYIVDEAHISTLAVHPSERKTGIGEGLLIHAMEDAESIGAEVVTLEVRGSNQPAILLYQKFGFEVVGKRPRYYQDNGEDAILMTLKDLPGWGRTRRKKMNISYG